MMRHLAALMLLLCSTAAAAEVAPLQPFHKESLSQIEAAHRNRPFILALWSISCDYCREELRLLSRLQQDHPQLEVVLVAADTPLDTLAVKEALAQLAPNAKETWLFADEFTAKLRFAVDRQWHGELPRNYLYSSDGTRRPLSGRLDAATVKRWLQGERHAR